MAKAFAVASRNVEHFRGQADRVRRVVSFINAPPRAAMGGPTLTRPDVVALYEAEGRAVFETVSDEMPDYTWHTTEGQSFMEIVVGVHKKHTAFFTQKASFKAGVPSLRPGAILTLTVAGERYTMLFLHTKSATDPRSMGLRDDALVKAAKFRTTLNKINKASGGSGLANYLFMGDLNTMGMKYPFKGSIVAETELRKLDSVARRRKMRRLSKDESASWSNGSGSSIPPPDLDQVVASEHLQFRKFKGSEVTVLGWPKQPTSAAQDRWIGEFSDHGMLYFEVQRV